MYQYRANGITQTRNNQYVHKPFQFTEPNQQQTHQQQNTKEKPTVWNE